jgi:asparagine synthase (glutamine-hydrolysing)
VCGIAIIADREERSSRPAIGAMMNALSHRGPDSRGERTITRCTLGHTRLEIIDLATGAQPLADASERYWITYNGEIYNYRELRDQLAALGHRFRTQSDSEVILAAYAEWGAESLNRLRGMFAFAIWDSTEGQLFAARDLFGEKPLYYATAADGAFLIASEIKALLASRKVEGRLDRTSVDAYLALGYIPPNRTIYSDVQTLRPGHYLRWNGTATVQRYWTPRIEPRERSLSDLTEELRHLLMRAVRRQLVADVEVGALLSGGIDSSIVVALAQQQRGAGEAIQTFSVGFGTAIHELPYARTIADRYKTDHHEIDLGNPPVATLLQKLACVYDEPFADSSQIPTYQIAQYARRFVKVVLTGDGGDELFGGYTRYLSLIEADGVTMPRLQWLLWRIAARFSGAARRSDGRRRATALVAQWRDPWQRAVMSHVAFAARSRSQLWGTEVTDDHLFDSAFRPEQPATAFDAAVHYDLTSYLPGDILYKVDRASMAHGLETRAPFLDRDVVEFALALPRRAKIDDGTTKVALKQAFACELPPEIQSRDKQGFEAPYSEWLASPAMKPLLDRVFNERSQLLELLPGAKEELQRRDHRTWILLMLGLWLEARRS